LGICSRTFWSNVLITEKAAELEAISAFEFAIVLLYFCLVKNSVIGQQTLVWCIHNSIVYNLVLLGQNPIFRGEFSQNQMQFSIQLLSVVYLFTLFQAICCRIECRIRWLYVIALSQFTRQCETCRSGARETREIFAANRRLNCLMKCTAPAMLFCFRFLLPGNHSRVY